VNSNGAQGVIAHYDVVVVGAGLGGIYAVHRFTQQGLSTLCLERAAGVGGVWRHNAYPGARVDIDSIDYCYHFSPEIYREWTWKERNASQPELLNYLNFVTDRLDLRRHMRFNSPLTDAVWDPALSCYRIKYGDGHEATARFLVLATGNLSEPRRPPFEGLDDYEGEWVQSSRWPDREIRFKGRRIAVVGAGSSAVQAIPVLAEQAEHLYVFQRTAHFSAPAHNGPMDAQRHAALATDVPARRAYLFGTPAGLGGPASPARRFSEYGSDERHSRLERAWASDGLAMSGVFADQHTDKSVNDVVSEFVRNKVRAIVKDPVLAEKLCAKRYSLGTRRMCRDTNYYETYNLENVSLVDVSADPIKRISRTGIETETSEYDVDLIIFAIGFQAFTGAWNGINIRNAQGARPTDSWERGPRTLLGLMTGGFPNLFTATGPGSPSNLANLFLMNEYHMDWIADCIAYMDRNGLSMIEPGDEAIDRWGEITAQAASRLLRLQQDNYMVHVNSDGTRVFIPYTGGFGKYIEQADEIAANDYAGFVFDGRRNREVREPTLRAQALHPEATPANWFE